MINVIHEEQNQSLTLPWRSIQPDDSHVCLPLLEHRREKAPHQSTVFCDLKTAWLLNIGSDSTSAMTERILKIDGIKSGPASKMHGKKTLSNILFAKASQINTLKPKTKYFQD